MGRYLIVLYHKVTTKMKNIEKRERELEETKKKFGLTE